VAELPTGTVTFLFTDVEGSTRLLHDLGDSYADVLAQHRRVLRDAFARHGGVEVDTQGDAFFFAFATASNAMEAAAEGRDALGGGPIRVRMGLHTGEPLVTEEGYVGIDVHRAARIAAAGHGGQILVSQPTRDLAARGLQDLGEHRLKDLAAAERIYQLGDGDFPPLKSLNNSNLPLPSEPLIGRKKELADVLRLLREGSRLVTLTGPGGIGKTRFALDVAAELIDAFRDGVWWVGLAPVRDATLVLSTLAAAIGAKTEIESELRGKQVLLLLDNFEQVVDAAADLAALQRSCEGVALLATSREPLHIAGEREYQLSPLPEAPAVELLRQRAEAVAPAFDADYGQLVELCERLDRLPLAIELAAARTKLLSVDTLLERLDQRLPLLTSRRRDVDERQRTLRATIEWSYDLLDEDEKESFARLSVFAGSFDFAAAEEVSDVGLDVLESLVDKSLLSRTPDGRFFMLETIREFAVERLGAKDDDVDVRGRHATHFARLVGDCGLLLEAGSEAGPRMDRLERDHNNIRAALEYANLTGDADRLVPIVCRVWPFWWVRGHIAEGRKWLDVALEEVEPASPLHWEAFEGAAHLAHVDGDQDRCRALAEQFLQTAHAAGDDRAKGMACHLLANAAIAKGALDEGMAFEEQSLELLGEDRYSRYPRSGLGYLAILTGQYERGAKLMETALELDRQADDLEGVSNGLALLAIAAAEGGLAELDAVGLLRQSAALARDLGYAQVLGNRVIPAGARLLLRKGDPARALTALALGRAMAEARGTGLGPLGEALYNRGWDEAVAALDDDAVERAADEGVRRHRTGESDAFVDEMLGALD
jgi:predicted ATPase